MIWYGTLALLAVLSPSMSTFILSLPIVCLSILDATSSHDKTYQALSRLTVVRQEVGQSLGPRLKFLCSFLSLSRVFKCCSIVVRSCPHSGTLSLSTLPPEASHCPSRHLKLHTAFLQHSAYRQRWLDLKNLLAVQNHIHVHQLFTVYMTCTHWSKSACCAGTY